MITNRHIPDDVQLIERNGIVFMAHPFKRYDPVTLTVMAVVGTGLQVASTLKQGKEAEKLAQARAQIDLKNAKATREASVEEATVKQEKGRRLLATQKSQAAAGGIRINVGSPLVIEAETKAIIAKDVGFILERGRERSGAFRSSAAIEIASGKAARKASVFKAIGQGISGFGTIANMSSAFPGSSPTTGTNILTTGSTGQLSQRLGGARNFAPGDF